MKLTDPDFSAAKLKKGREFASAPMNAILGRPKTPDLEYRVNTLPPQTDSSGGKLPPAVRPTYQGPNDEDPLRHTVPLVPGMHLAIPPKEGYSSQSKPRPLYENN